MKNFKSFFSYLVLFTLFFSVPAAHAHKFVLVPDSFITSSGASNGVSAAFTEIIGKGEFPFTAAVSAFESNGATVTALLDLVSAAGVREDVYSKLSPEGVFDKAVFSVTQSGTAVLEGRFEGVISPTEKTVSHAKTFLNLSADGMATKRLGGDNFLEVVFAEEIPAGGIKEGDTVKFRFYHLGKLMKNVPVFAAYIGAPEYEAEEEGSLVAVNDYLEKETDGNGEASFLFDHAAGWFVGAFAGAGEDAEYGGGLMFEVSKGESDEGDITDFIITESANKAGIGFPSWVDGKTVDFVREKWGYVNASNLVTAPQGSTAFLTGQANQLPGEGTGAVVRIPMDIVRVGSKGVTGIEQMLTLTPDILGKEAFDDMAAFLKKERLDSPGKFFPFPGYGTWYVPYTPKLFFGEFGVAIMAKFSGGGTRDISDVFQVGVLYDESDLAAGKILVMYGAVLVDSAPVGGAYWLDATDVFFPGGNPNKVALIYDGAADNVIEFSYWLSKAENEPHKDSGGGGCDAASWGWAGGLAGVVWSFAARRKKGK
jgi:uncharacterized GH25 family protein